jgi:hypothetical protein
VKHAYLYLTAVLQDSDEICKQKEHPNAVVALIEAGFSKALRFRTDLVSLKSKGSGDRQGCRAARRSAGT